MNQFQNQYNEVQELLQFNEIQQVIKRIIDFTLDTEQVDFYKKTVDFLNWFDVNEANTEEIKQKLTYLLDDLHQYLKEKKVENHQKIISVAQLCKKYNTSFELGPIDLEIKTGEIIGLVGENGNGKTTLLRLICGELHPTDGKISYNFNYTDAYDLRSQLVYIPQRTNVWKGSMYENLEFAASCYGYSAEENNLLVDLVITRLGLRKFKKYNWNGLSSGYKMRFELARMLLRKPKILLIDEPLANLDILAQQTVLDDFRNIANSAFRPMAMVLSSQQLYEVEKTSNQVLFLKNGKQKHLNQSNENEQLPLIIELETNIGITELKNIFTSIQLENIEQNGGTFILSFGSSTTMKMFLETLVKTDISVQYFRNISQSTRRFFVN